MQKLIRQILPAFVAGLAGAWLAIAAWPVATDAQGYRPPRLADGHPDLNGIWQALNEANYDIQMHTRGRRRRCVTDRTVPSRQCRWSPSVQSAPYRPALAWSRARSFRIALTR